MFGVYHTCDNCGGLEERVFADSYTGYELCVECLCEEPETGNKNPLWQLTMSPEEDGDNIEALFPGLKTEVEA